MSLGGGDGRGGEGEKDKAIEVCDSQIYLLSPIV